MFALWPGGRAPPLRLVRRPAPNPQPAAPPAAGASARTHSPATPPVDQDPDPGDDSAALTILGDSSDEAAPGRPQAQQRAPAGLGGLPPLRLSEPPLQGFPSLLEDGDSGGAALPDRPLSLAPSDAGFVRQLLNTLEATPAANGPVLGDGVAGLQTLCWGASQDQRLLWAAGPARSPLYPAMQIERPACAQGPACVGVNGGIATGSAGEKSHGGRFRAILAAALEPGELDRLERTGELVLREGSPLGGAHRYCVLCLRRLLTLLVTAVEAGALPPAEAAAVSRRGVLQPFSAPATESGYLDSLLLRPSASAPNGLVAPFVSLDLSRLRWTLDEATGAWRVDQSGMLASMQHFRQRAPRARAMPGRPRETSSPGSAFA